MFLSSLPTYTHIELRHFRFQKQDMDRLLEALQIPDSYTSHQGSVFTGMESLMILLRHLSYPNRWCDLVPSFGRTEQELSMVFNMVIMKHLNVHKLRRCINLWCTISAKKQTCNSTSNFTVVNIGLYSQHRTLLLSTTDFTVVNIELLAQHPTLQLSTADHWLNIGL